MSLQKVSLVYTDIQPAVFFMCFSVMTHWKTSLLSGNEDGNLFHTYIVNYLFLTLHHLCY